MNSFKKLKVFAGVAALAVVVGVAVPAQATPFMGGPDDALFGCDILGACSITLDELGNISGVFGGFFGPYSVTLTHIASTVDPSFVDDFNNPLEVTSYSVVGKGGIAPLRLTAGALGLCEDVVDPVTGRCVDALGRDRKSDVLIFTPLNIDANGFGHSRIDFLSDVLDAFTFATGHNVLEVGLEGNNGAFYRSNGASQEHLDYNIISDSVPEPASIVLLGTGLLACGRAARKRMKK